MVRRLPLIALSLGYLMVIVDATAVNVALPALRADFGGTVRDLQWVLDAYALAFAALLLTGGALGDRLGARRVFVVGLTLFAIASAACGAAPSVATLVAARTLQGVGAALLVPASLALLRAAYTDRAQRARAVGAWAGIAGIGERPARGRTRRRRGRLACGLLDQPADRGVRAHARRAPPPRRLITTGRRLRPRRAGARHRRLLRAHVRADRGGRARLERSQRADRARHRSARPGGVRVRRAARRDADAAAGAPPPADVRRRHRRRHADQPRPLRPAVRQRACGSRTRGTSTRYEDRRRVPARGGHGSARFDARRSSHRATRRARAHGRRPADSRGGTARDGGGGSGRELRRARARLGGDRLRHGLHDARRYGRGDRVRPRPSARGSRPAC